MLARFSSAACRMSTFQPGIVYTTCGNSEEAKALARALISAKVAACVQLNSVQSVYNWSGKLEEDDEVRLTIKCDLSKYTELEAAIKQHHSYDTPQIIGVPASHASPEYVSWMKAETTQSAEK